MKCWRKVFHYPGNELFKKWWCLISKTLLSIMQTFHLFIEIKRQINFHAKLPWLSFASIILISSSNKKRKEKKNLREILYLLIKIINSLQVSGKFNKVLTGKSEILENYVILLKISLISATNSSIVEIISKCLSIAIKFF